MLARARGDLSYDLALEAGRVEPALTNDDGAAGEHAAVEIQCFEHERGTGDQPCAERRPQPAGETARGAAHRDPARQPDRFKPPLQPAHGVWVRTLLRSEHRRGLLKRRAHVAQDGQPRAAQPAAVGDRGERARTAVGARAAAGRHQDVRRAAGDGGQDQMARSGAGRGLGVALPRRDEGEPARRSHLDERCAPVAQQREVRRDLASERIARRGGHDLAAEAVEQDRHRALAAVRDRRQVDGQAGARETAPSRLRDPLSRQRSLEGVGSDQDGPVVQGHRAAFSQGDEI